MMLDTTFLKKWDCFRAGDSNPHPERKGGVPGGQCGDGLARLGSHPKYLSSY